jgi:hypothetical protein
MILVESAWCERAGKRARGPLLPVAHSISIGLLALFIKHIGPLHQSFDFTWLLSRQEATINDTDLSRHHLESILDLDDRIFCCAAKRFTFLREADNYARPFCFQPAKVDFQFVGFPDPTDEIFVGLDTNF